MISPSQEIAASGHWPLFPSDVGEIIEMEERNYNLGEYDFKRGSFISGTHIPY
jgi:hypothetical protein